MAKHKNARQGRYPTNGEQFGRLTVLGSAPDRTPPSGGAKRFVYCRCQCDGREHELAVNALRTGNTRSCGCLRRELMSVRESVIGKRFGCVTVLADAEDHVFPSGARRRRVVAQCDCTNKTVFKPMLAHLIRGGTTSCGGSVHHRSYTHGMTGTPEHGVWKGMHTRCSGGGSEQSRRDYYERGIRVCERWSGPGGFANFFTDMGPRPNPKLTIERRDNDKGYSPDNCYWGTWAQQKRNMRSNVWIDYGGERLCLWDASQAADIWHTDVIAWARDKEVTPQVAFDCYAFVDANVMAMHMFWAARAWLAAHSWIPAGLHL
jgi:hypothetical protein